jgi:Protein required for attachment to host cells
VRSASGIGQPAPLPRSALLLAVRAGTLSRRQPPSEPADLNHPCNESDTLLLVAPARTLRVLREALDDRIRKKLVGALEKDLVKTPDHDLWRHVRVWVTPERTPAA